VWSGLWELSVVGFRMFEWGITSHDAHEGEIKGTGQLWSPRAPLPRPTTLNQRPHWATCPVAVGACLPTPHVSDDEGENRWVASRAHWKRGLCWEKINEDGDSDVNIDFRTIHRGTHRPKTKHYYYFFSFSLSLSPSAERNGMPAKQVPCNSDIIFLFL